MRSAVGMSHIRLSRDLAAAGFSPGELARMTRAGELVHLRRGAYAEPTERELDPRVAHLRLLEATVAQCAPDAVVSHTSAGVLHELPVWREHLSRVHLTRDRRGGGRARRWVQAHGVLLTDTDVVEVGGYRVTGLARTVVDLGCCLPLTQAVAAGDVALAWTDRAEIIKAPEGFRLARIRFSVSSTARPSTASCCVGRDRARRRYWSRGSGARIGCGSSVGSSSAGCGRT